MKGHKIEEKELQNIDVTMHKEAIDTPNLSVTTRPPWINKKKCIQQQTWESMFRQTSILALLLHWAAL